MTATTRSLIAFLAASPEAALVEVAEARGSTPREKGAWMLVSPVAIFGTIGGGQLEFMAIDKARAMLKGRAPMLAAEAGIDAASDALAVSGEASPPGPSPRSRGEGARRADEGQRQVGTAGITLDIPLGPEIGQCCGGRVAVGIRPIDDALRQELIRDAEAEDARRPHVYVFGGGHVGLALASAFALLPVETIVVETRADALESMPDPVTTRLTPMPEEMVREAPAGAAFVVLTHDHALDFLIVAEALKRDDAAYVGMIGSKTKKATFKSWYLKTAGGTEKGLARLVSPIGGEIVKDKRPAVIAALAAAEIMTALLSGKAAAQIPSL
ncbi:xanthine dehydrogenase accessory protein XdhC [Mesorhizobium sp. L-8-10]|uniref:xanthine dehydrogenase accessory protein XdhC n=1 Tax=Mesorhizobium sp. L-8-10 TaxID=2744523 RepID=UPI0019275D3D|nr:xanthine dehydrogenase accessory protein XdhC [Mesorhizobium sp. L-8-10]BCH30680.1 xanthine dehydrogenase accessory protein XdhC [Mesorhizobium sp. L-8-10]